MPSKAQLAADAIAGLDDPTDPTAVARVTHEFPAKDVAAAAATVGGSPGGSQPEILRVKKTLTSANILALHTGTGIEVLPSPGANKIAAPFWGFTVFHHGTTPYAADLNDDFSIATPLSRSDGNIQYAWLVAGHLGINNAWDSVGTLASDAFSGGPLFIQETTSGYLIDQPLHACTFSAVPADGDGTLDVYLAYMVLDA